MQTRRPFDHTLASSEVHEKRMQVDYNLWNLFIRTISPPLNTYKILQNMNVNHYFSAPEIFNICSFLDNLVSYLKSTAESSIATKQVQTSLRFYVQYNFNSSLPSQFLPLVISVTTFTVHVRQILKYLILST